MIYIISVNYNQNSYLRGFIDSLPKSDNFKFIIVNNGSQRWDSNSHRIVSIDSKNNGYLSGLKTGFNYLMERFSPNNNDIVILSNPDVILSDNFFENILNIPSFKNSCYLIAPSIINLKSGMDQNPNMLYSMSRFKYIISSIEMSNYLSFLIIRKIKHFLKDFSKPKSVNHSKKICDIFAPHGSFMITSVLSIKQSNMLDHPIFLWGEEVCISDSLRKAGGQIKYYPSIMVYHNEHSSTSTIPSRLSYQIWKKSFAIYKSYLR